MRHVPAAPPRRSPHAIPGSTERRQAHFELLGLIASSAVIALGILLAYRHQAVDLAVQHNALAARMIVNLSALRTPGDLAPVLTPFGSDAERVYVASETARWIRNRNELTHVGALAAIRVPAADVRDRAALDILKQRATGGSTSVALFSSSNLAAIKPSVVVRTPEQYRRCLALTVAFFFVAFATAHVWRRVRGEIGDGTILPAVQLLTGLSLLAMIGLRDPLRDTLAITSVATGIASGLVVLCACAGIDFERKRFHTSTILPLGLAVALAAALLVAGTGPGESGVKVNLFGVQPIEPIRVLAVFALAAYFGRRWEMLRELSDGIGRSAIVRRYARMPRWRDVQPLIVIVGTLLTFFVLQRDLGPALVLGSIALALYGVARGGAPLVAAGFAGLLTGIAGAYWLGVPRTLARRVAIWLDPWDNGLVGGDQVAHGLWAMASGGFGGAGPAGGDTQLVPAGHTDLIVAVLGEDFGLIGAAVAITAFALIVWRVVRIAARAGGDYSTFLALGCALSLAVPAIVIVGGLLGLLPLSGVVTPFLSFGKSSMICNLAVIGVSMAIARRCGSERPHFTGQLRTLQRVLVVVVVVICGKMTWVQWLDADAIALRPTLVRQADGLPRYQYNPRLLLAARAIPRGTIYDRNGFAVAATDPAVTQALADRLRVLGRDRAPCQTTSARCYPLGGAGFHVIGDIERTNWSASNASFVERDLNGVLQGFNDRPAAVTIATAGRESTTVTRDLRPLLPLLRHKGDPDHPSVRALLKRNRDAHLTVDAPLQALVAGILESRLQQTASRKGAAVVVDVDTGALLASVSYPWPTAAAPTNDQLLDRARYGMYPPGSTFKLITAAAALNTLGATGVPQFMCSRLPDGRVGAQLPGVPRPVRDDPMDREPHGHVDLHSGLVVSCNAYFAQLAVALGPEALALSSAAVHMQAANEPVIPNLRKTLPGAGYGQGQVLSSPLRMARAVAAIAGDGTVKDVPLVATPADEPIETAAWLGAPAAAALRRAMRDVVEHGTGRVLAGHPVAIAGKTGTAEVDGAAPHSWFVGFAPADTRAGRRVAFAVVVENGGYGGRTAAPIAGDIVSAAVAAGLIP